MSLPDLAILSATSRMMRTVTQEHMHLRVRQRLAPFGVPTRILLAVLRKSHSVVSGSTALHSCLPRGQRTWTPHDIDIYTAEQGFPTLMATFLLYGYVTMAEFANVGSTKYSDIALKYDFRCDIRRVVKLGNSSRTVDIIISNSSSPIRPIFHFHSTAVINYISDYGVFCAYPVWMSRLISVVNPLVHSRGRDDDGVHVGRRVEKCIEKYTKRGFRCVNREDIDHDELGCSSPLCRNPDRYTHDGGCLFLPFNDSQQPRTTKRVTVQKRTYLLHHDVRWSLGSDSCEDGFQDTEAYVL